MKMTTRIIGVIVVCAFIIGIGGTMAAGLWSTSSSRVPAKIQTGAFAGTGNPGDIRGSYSLGDVEAAFGIPVAITAQAFGLSGRDDPASIKAKDFEGLFANSGYDVVIETDALRVFVALYLGIPYAGESETKLPPQAREVLRSRLSVEDMNKAEPFILPAPGESGVAASTGSKVSAGSITSTGSSSSVSASSSVGTNPGSGFLIKGNTTFGELYALGLTEKQVGDAMGISPGPRTQSIRDFAALKGAEFSVYKNALQALVDAKP